MDGMNEFTLLDDAVQGFGDAAADNGVGEIGRWQEFTKPCDLGGVRRCLFGVGEGSTEAKQDSRNGVSQRLRESDEWVSRHVLATCH